MRFLSCINLFYIHQGLVLCIFIYSITSPVPMLLKICLVLHGICILLYLPFRCALTCSHAYICEACVSAYKDKVFALFLKFRTGSNERSNDLFG